ncbi:MAG: methyl-accepting chemotaxis protein [Syntrophothermaceae bacterium]|jgi:methyl-accepting chemotaxis protein
MIRGKLNVGGRLIVIFVTLIVIITGSMSYYATSSMKDKIINSAEEKLQSDMKIGMALLEHEFPGAWSIGPDGKMYKGEVLMEENFGVIDQIGKETGDTVTIFKDDTRVSTNVKKDGVRQVGTQASAEVVEKVLKKGQTYIGEAEVVGTRNLTAYEPIKDIRGEIIGMWYVGVPATPYDNMAAAFARNMLWCALAGIIAAALAALLVARNLSKRLQIIEQNIGRAAEGDLTVRTTLKAEDEIGRVGESLNQMVEKISALIGQAQNLTENVISVLDQLRSRFEGDTRRTENMTKQADDMAKNAQTQVEMSQQSRVIINEMSAGIQQVAANAQDVSAVSVRANETAEEGGVQVKEVIQQMDVISETVNSAAGIVEGLGEKSQEIGEIVDVITGIAEQTNLLALNAAIEAARAGEQGRGFAVVAEEVRKLAEESGGAAKKIAELIKEIQMEASRAVQAMAEGTHEAENGMQVVARSGEAFQAITESIKGITGQIQEVSAAAEEMAAATESALESMNQTASAAEATFGAASDIDQMTAEQLAGIQEANVLIERLAVMVADLEKDIDYFKVEASLEKIAHKA